MMLSVQTTGRADFSVLDPNTILRNWVYEGVTARPRIGDAGQLGSPLLAGYEWL